MLVKSTMPIREGVVGEAMGGVDKDYCCGRRGEENKRDIALVVPRHLDHLSSSLSLYRLAAPAPGLRPCIDCDGRKSKALSDWVSNQIQI